LLKEGTKHPFHKKRQTSLMQLKILARWYQMIKGVFGKFASFTLAKSGKPIWLVRPGMEKA